MKDLFSQQADSYARYRPLYPQALYDFIYSHVRTFDKAWDCGTGNGQVARVLAQRFKEVLATDISTEQLSRAEQAPNIRYIRSGEQLDEAADDSFDLVTVAAAVHWFDFDKFYKEVNRVSKPGAIIAVWCYNLLKVDKEIDSLIDNFTFGLLGPFWDKERKYVDEGYRKIPFPFDEIKPPSFSITDTWTLDRLKGYLNSWSSVQHYMKANGENPVDAFSKSLEPLWRGEKHVELPLPMRIGIVH